MRFPKILLITEAVFSNDSVGASRTLLNLLKEYPPENILLLSPKGSFKKYEYISPFNKNNLFFTFSLLQQVSMQNRIGLYLNKLIRWINFLWLEIQPLKYDKTIQEFAPDAVLAVPLFPETLIVAKRIFQRKMAPSFVYLMDDWITSNSLSWGASNLKATAKEVLSTSKWLMISPNLRDRFVNFYSLRAPDCFVVHNPVEIAPYSPKSTPLDTFTIAYAGSIWEMHLDALKLIALAVRELRASGLKIKLVLYCGENFYQMAHIFWNENEVEWGGLIPYKDLNDKLKQADLLLVTTSFSENVAHLVSTSVLTKTTDYMNAGRPMLSIGPSYSATNQFVKEYKIGYTIESNQLEYIKEGLLSIVNDPNRNEELAYTAHRTLEEHFSSNVITKKLASILLQNV